MKRNKIIQLIVYVAFACFVMFSISALTSCKKAPACETGNFGWVLVENQTVYDAIVDVGETYEAFLHHGESYDYGEVTAETIQLWLRFDGEDDWYYEYENLAPCEDMTFTWNVDGKKSTGKNVYLQVSRGGETYNLTPKIIQS